LQLAFGHQHIEQKQAAALFSISIGKPLRSLEATIELISHITFEEGFTVTDVKDTHNYLTGFKVSDEDIAARKITNHPFYDDWNNAIQSHSRTLYFCDGSFDSFHIHTSSILVTPSAL
jgi:hypothetical protein